MHVRKMFVAALTAALFLLPFSAFAGGGQEQISKGDVQTMIKDSAVDFQKTFNDNCGKCHGRTPMYPVQGANLSYSHSGHALGFEKMDQNSWYANGSGCQQCHTSEGFTEYIDTGKVDSKGYVSYPSQIGCFTCHDPHNTGDFSLVTEKPVTLQSGDVFDVGKSNLCANCHQARRKATDLVVPTPAAKVSSHWGAHHGPHGDVFLGKNGYEFEGKKYSTSAHTMVAPDGCVTCHMALPEGRYSMSSAVGGHSFYIEGDVHGAEKLNLSACKSCHTDIKQTGAYFNITDKDFDNDGTVEPIQAEVKGLLELLVNSKGTGVLQTTPVPVYKADGSWNATKSESERSIAEMGALYNYKFILEDRSLGVHNPTYVIELLYDSIQSLNPSFNISNRP